MSKLVPDFASTNKPAKREHLPADREREADGLIHQGYSFNQAVADIVDNALDEKAGRILIRFLLRKGGGYDLLIADDGTGMTEEELREGMRVGTPKRKGSTKLGKFGLGLKQASLSRCERLIVASRSQKNSIPAACAWDREGFRISMAEFWTSDTAAHFFDKSFSGLDLKKQGTIVYWQQADITSSPEIVQVDRRDLKTYLGVHFHHFITAGIEFFVDTQTLGDTQTGLDFESISAISPFGYIKSGAPGYPLDFKVDFKGFPPVKVRAHIFPHKKNQVSSEKESYRLYLGANNAAGFYIYRNKRLIVAGDWLGRRKQEAHASLARIEMFLPPELDECVRLNVQKFSTQFPRGFVDAIWSAKSGGISFPDYLQAADKAYCLGAGKQNIKDYPFVPDSGFPTALREAYKGLIGAKAGRSRIVKFEWIDNLPAHLFYEVDRETKTIQLNCKHRDAFTRGRASPVDAPLVKLLLLALLETDLDRGKITRACAKRHLILNEMIIRCLAVEN